ncbi:MAG TPA: phytanoyl-CoA dioxygenase family protein, partial [Verrucomicrobiae bacterium]
NKFMHESPPASADTATRPIDSGHYKSSLIELGCVLVQGVITKAQVETLAGSLAVDTGRAGARRMLGSNPIVDELCHHGELKELASVFLGCGAFPVRCILFDKTPEANWRVPWHQDLAIPVKERIECEGFGGWSQKAGVWHVHPPARILAGMVTLRLHLDDCPESNGPLQILPGSHRQGILSNEEVSHWKTSVGPVICAAVAGDVLVMRPLVLHASSPSQNAKHRRVLHVEYAVEELPGRLEWAEG